MSALLDAALERAFGNHRQTCRFIQIGGNDGVFEDPLYKHHHSVSYAFEWGQIFEPIPEYFDLLVENMRPFAYISCHRTAVDARDAPGTREFSFVSPVDIERLGLPRSSQGIGSFSRDRNALGGIRYSETKFAAIKDHIRTTEVTTVPASHVIAQFPDTNLLLTDCEGHDVEIISAAFDVPDFRPHVVQFEYLGMMDELFKSTVDRLRSIGYEINRSGKDVICELGTAV
jgi:hypothetical protein